MFEKFCSKFDATIKNNNVELQERHKDILNRSIGAVVFMQNFEGITFKDGLYRIHKVSELNKWKQLIYEAFPMFTNKIFCFSYDWLGRHFAIDFSRQSEGEPMILMLEPGTGEAHEIPANFTAFHEEELVFYQDAALAASFFKEWKSKNPNSLDLQNCIGYKIPLFLGGEDEVSNLEEVNMEVYWGLMGQLMKS